MSALYRIDATHTYSEVAQGTRAPSEYDGAPVTHTVAPFYVMATSEANARHAAEGVIGMAGVSYTLPAVPNVLFTIASTDLTVTRVEGAE